MRPDPNELNQIKFMDYNYCENFEFPPYYDNNYEDYMRDFVVSYSETFILGKRNPVELNKSELIQNRNGELIDMPNN